MGRMYDLPRARKGGGPTPVIRPAGVPDSAQIGLGQNTTVMKKANGSRECDAA